MEKCFYEKNAFTVAPIRQGIQACTQSFGMCIVLLAHTWLFLSKLCILYCSLNGHQEPSLCPTQVKILFCGGSRGPGV